MMEFILWLIFIKIVSQAGKGLIKKDCDKKTVMTEKDCNY